MTYYNIFKYTIEDAIVSIATKTINVFAVIFCIFTGSSASIFDTILVINGCIRSMNINAPIPQTRLKLKVILPFRFRNSPV